MERKPPRKRGVARAVVNEETAEKKGVGLCKRVVEDGHGTAVLWEQLTDRGVRPVGVRGATGADHALDDRERSALVGIGVTRVAGTNVGRGEAGLAEAASREAPLVRSGNNRETGRGGGRCR